MDWIGGAWEAARDYPWGLFLRSAGFGGLAAVIAASVAYAGVRRTTRTQREASRKQQWWERARWALDHALSTEEADRDVGIAVLGALADSEYADEHEGDVIDAALDAILRAYFTTGSSQAETGAAPEDRADSEHEPGDEP